MFIFNLRLLSIVFLLAWPGFLFALTEQRNQSFNADLQWEGNGNRTAPQDFGLSLSLCAGGQNLGEGGGTIERGAPAWYADQNLGTLNLATDNLNFSGMFILKSFGNPSFGYFTDNWNPGSFPPEGMMFRIDDNNVYLRWMNDGVAGEILAGSVMLNVPFDIALSYDAGPTGGNGVFSLSIDEGTPVTRVIGSADKGGININRFGLFTLGSSSGHATQFYFDDLDYTVEANVAVPDPIPFLPGTILESIEIDEDFDSDPGWEGMFNRASEPDCREVTQDFGYSGSSSHTGGNPGEMGGLLESAADTAYYAMEISPLTLDDPLTASGKMIIPDDGSNSNHFLVGFFNHQTADEWRTANSIVMRILTRGSDSFFAFPEYCNGRWRAGSIAETLFTIGPSVYDWTLSYNPDGDGGNGTVTLELGTETMVVDLVPGHKSDGAVFNRFGLMPVIRSVDSGAEYEVFLDDITVNGVTEDFDSDPIWDETGNRATFNSCVVRPRFDFGYSPTQNAGGNSAGELGGVVWRGDFSSEKTMAHYADPIETISVAGPLKASGKVSLDQGVSDSSVLIGWFHSVLSRQAGNVNNSLPQNFMGIAVEGPSSDGFFFRPGWRMNGSNQFLASAGPNILPDGSSLDWSFEFNPGGCEGGQVTVTLAGQSITVELLNSELEKGAEFDRFGIITTQVDGHQQQIWFDDLVYTHSQESSIFTTAEDEWLAYP
jgi:hypothetical protein